MAATALIRIADAKRLAKVAKSEGVAVSVKLDGREITIFPEYQQPKAKPPVDEEEDIRL